MDDNTFVDLVGCVFVVGILFAVIAVWWKIIGKTGNHPALSLLMVVPLANLVMLVWLALSEWPVHRRLRQLEGGEGLLHHFE